jgi:selenide,water dikinase
MQAATTPIVRDIVLIGGGHSHVVVLRRFAMQPLAGVRLTVLCTDTDTPYSGMLPGYIAGHYDFDAVHIDLRRLAEFAGARYFRDEVVGIDRSARRCCAVRGPRCPMTCCRSTSARHRSSRASLAPPSTRCR